MCVSGSATDPQPVQTPAARTREQSAAQQATAIAPASGIEQLLQITDDVFYGIRVADQQAKGTILINDV